MSFKSNNSHYLLCTILCLLCLSCAKESSPEEVLGETTNASAWISNLGKETNLRAKLSINDSNEYNIVGKDYILKVDADGNVTEEIQNLFPAPPAGLYERQHIFNDKVYGFTGDTYPGSAPDQNIELKIYDMNGNIEQSTVLDANYVLIDVAIEEDKITLLTWDWNDPNVSSASTKIFQVDYSGQLLFSKNLTSISGVERVFRFMLLQDGNFVFDYEKTLYKVNHEFELISSTDLGYINTRFTQDPDGNIFVGGEIYGNTNGITKFDTDLNELNKITFVSEQLAPIHPSLTNYWFGSLAIHGDYLYTQLPAAEYAQELRLQCFDLDLNMSNEIILTGSGPISELVINELDNVSFLYGVPHDTPDGSSDPTLPTEARLFKFDVDCQLPELIINN